MDVLVCDLLSKHTAVGFEKWGKVKGKRERERKKGDYKGGELNKRKREKEITSCGSSSIQLGCPGSWGTHTEQVHWAF